MRRLKLLSRTASSPYRCPYPCYASPFYPHRTSRRGHRRAGRPRKENAYRNNGKPETAKRGTRAAHRTRNENAHRMNRNPEQGTRANHLRNKVVYFSLRLFYSSPLTLPPLRLLLPMPLPYPCCAYFYPYVVCRWQALRFPLSHMFGRADDRRTRRFGR